MKTIEISFSGSAEEIGRLLIGLDDLGYINLQEWVDPLVRTAMLDLERPSWVVQMKKACGDKAFQQQRHNGRRRMRDE